MQFLHPLLAMGALLFVVPLIIHLLNRQRYRRLEWAAMEFVLAAHRRTRRRVRFQNLLLLLLRCLAVVLLALGLGRLFLDGAPERGALGTRGPEHLVVVVDNSYSMGHRDAGQDRTRFEQAVERAREEVQTVQNQGGETTLLLAGEVARELGTLRELSNYKGPGYESFRLEQALRTALLRLRQTRELEERTRAGRPKALRLLVLSDLQYASFPKLSDAGVERQAIEDAFADLTELGVVCQLERIGSGEVPTNVAITDLRVDQAVSVDDLVAVHVRIANLGLEIVPGIELSLSVNGRPQQSGESYYRDERGALRTSARFALQPGEEQPRTLYVPITTAGDQAIEVRAVVQSMVELDVDNRRRIVVHAHATPRILLVNGSEDEDPYRDAAALLESYLAIPNDDQSATRFQVETVPPSRLRQLLTEDALAAYASVCLSNVGDPQLDGPQRLALGRFVARGGSLVVFLGDRLLDADPTLQERRLEAFQAAFRVPAELVATGTAEERADGEARDRSLLPARLLGPSLVENREVGYDQIGTFDPDYPAFRAMRAASTRALVTGPPVYGFVRVEPPDDEEVRVAARLKYDRSPFLLERFFGHGRCILITSTASLRWNRLLESPRTAIPFLNDLFDHATRPLQYEQNLGMRDPIRWTVPYAPREFHAIDPDELPIDLGGRRPVLRGGRYELPELAPRQDNRPEPPGLYRLEIAVPPDWVREARVGRGDETVYFARNLDPREANLAPADRGPLEEDYTVFAVRGEAGAGGSPFGANREISLVILYAVLAFLLGETFLNMWFSRRRAR